ncbi:hypothetical protein FNV43_RR01046 [Rhamnella rubrinervis]|uniref:Uncharacterized protein n=1 Tax=Rhamnella rubrinervis TaxID=2594499 RepID=A0A8K0MRP9_9ROSA|nr:hypothetical protein FNV43_RR01046 [Rhamnella rubrinervis]
MSTSRFRLQGQVANTRAKFPLIRSKSAMNKDGQKIDARNKPTKSSEFDINGILIVISRGAYIAGDDETVKIRQSVIAIHT